MAIITLLTDFGTQDEYVGVIKGVIVGINSAVTMIDITHGITPQNLTSAAYALMAAFPVFPQGTIHMAVVDPTVGTQRDIVAVQCAGHLFLAPDNGLLAPILEAYPPEAGHRVENESLFRRPVSRTFHGRDIFAPVAAHLSVGMPLKNVGRPLDLSRLCPLAVAQPHRDSSGALVGTIVHVDRFGNLITNIGRRHLLELGSAKIDIQLGTHIIEGLAENYAQGSHGEPLALLGSRDCLEIAVYGGSAAALFENDQSRTVRVRVKTQ
jgi:S-adenosyl-L-methionine hydrolase (adenosine-forming)